MDVLRTLLLLAWAHPFIALVVALMVGLGVLGLVDTAWAKVEERRRQKDPSYWW